MIFKLGKLLSGYSQFLLGWWGYLVRTRRGPFLCTKPQRGKQQTIELYFAMPCGNLMSPRGTEDAGWSSAAPSVWMESVSIQGFSHHWPCQDKPAISLQRSNFREQSLIMCTQCNRNKVWLPLVRWPEDGLCLSFAGALQPEHFKFHLFLKIDFLYSIYLLIRFSTKTALLYSH